MAAVLTLSACSVREASSYRRDRRPFNAEAVTVSVAGGVSEPSLFRYLRRHGMERSPNVDELIALKEAGASDQLLVAVLRAPLYRPVAASLAVYRWMELDLGLMGRIALWPLGGLQLGGDPPPPPRERPTVGPPEKKKEKEKR